jgi:hypothetical protein
MTVKALTYAQDTLGVNKIWEDANALTSVINSLQQTWSGLDNSVRTTNYEIDRRKNEILVDCASHAADGESAAAFERRVKLAQAGDEQLINLHKMLLDDSNNRSAIETQIRSVETNLKAHVARLNELGGYFQYLASAKDAQTAQMAQVNNYPW